MRRRVCEVLGGRGRGEGGTHGDVEFAEFGGGLGEHALLLACCHS